MEKSILIDKIVTDDICYMIKSFDFKVVEFGKLTILGKMLKNESFTHFYKLVYVEKGTIYFSYKNQKIGISQGSVLYLPPETAVFGDDEENEEVQIWFLSYQMGNLNKRQEYNDYMRETFNDFSVQDKEGVCRSIFNSLIEEGIKKELGYCISVQSKFVDLLVNMIRLSSSDSAVHVSDIRSTSTFALFNQATLYMNEHIKNNIKVKDIAEEIGISEVYLYKIFMKHAGKSPQQMLMSYRLQLAKNYLIDPSISIKTIAYELGFLSSGYFSTAFKNEEGITPREYRQRELSKTDKEIKNCCSIEKDRE